MIRQIKYIFIIQFFLLTSLSGAADEKLAASSDLTVEVSTDNSDADNQALNDFLLNPKNPFLKLVPKPVVEVKPVVQPVVVEKPKEKIDLSVNFKLTGLVWGTDLPQAIINDQLVAEGEFIQMGSAENVESVQVLKINKRGVRLKSQDGSSFFIRNQIK